MLPIAEVVRHDLDAEIWHRIETFLREEDSADALRSLQVAKLESDELLQPVEVAVDCSVVPACRYHEFHTNILVVVRPN